MDAELSTRSKPFPYFWMRLTYGATATLGIITGNIMLLAPERFARKFVGFPYMLPPQDPIVYGALASIWLTVGILCVFGVRAPLKFLPLLALQLIYKTAWFAFIFFPLWFQGNFPEWGWASVVGNAIWMALDIKSIPWSYLFAPDSPDAESHAVKHAEQRSLRHAA